MQPSGRAVELLLVGDCADDARVASETLHRAKEPRRVTVTPSGVEALQILRRQTPAFTNAPRPDLILLLPHAPYNGHGLLEEIKSDPALRHIPVMVVSDSDTGDDLERAYNHHANCYIRKPAGADGLAEVIRSIDRFWLDIVTLPPR